ncbi:hypothetical protein AB6A40_006682 [Gnathostoma spinigerum]|uniref:Kinetochore protein Nuf2 N-terminal domain-containing protein n=1 Tax=Gnathostoma spinigerum TaxID=75299 RepID=A0ABD6EJ20_9BILA
MTSKRVAELAAAVSDYLAPLEIKTADILQPTGMKNCEVYSAFIERIFDLTEAPLTLMPLTMEPEGGREMFARVYPKLTIFTLLRAFFEDISSGSLEFDITNLFMPDTMQTRQFFTMLLDYCRFTEHTSKVISEMYVEFDSRKTKLMEEEQELLKLANDVAQKKALVNNQKRTLLEKKQHLDSVVTSCQKTEKEAHEIGEKTEECQSLYSELIEKQKILKASQESAQVRNEILSMEVTNSPDRLQSEVHVLEEERVELNRRRDMKQRELNDQLAKKTLRANAQRLIQMLSNETSSFTPLKTEKEQREAKLTEGKMLIANSSDELRGLVTKLDSCKAQLEELENSFRKAQQSHIAGLNDLAEQQKNIQLQIADIVKRNENAARKNADASRQLNMIRDEMATVTREAESDFRTLALQLKSISAKFHTAKKEYRQLKDDYKCELKALENRLEEKELSDSL